MKWKIYILDLLIVLSFIGCSNNSGTSSLRPQSSTSIQTNISKFFSQTTLVDNAKKAALSYQDIYNSVKENSAKYEQYVNFIVPDSEMQKIIMRISALGYPVYSCGFNPEHLDQMVNFYQHIQSGENADLIFFQVQKNGSLQENELKFHNGKFYLSTITAAWNISKQLSIGDIGFYLIDQFKLTKNDYFLYHAVGSSSWQNYSSGFRIRTLPNENFRLYEKFIEPVGYLGNNIFLTDWNKNTISKLNFNDMFQYVYNLEYSKKPDYKKIYHWDSAVIAIPANDFEGVITEYFPVTIKQLRQLAVYDSKENVYPWTDCFVEDEANTTPSAEIIHFRCNKDGSLTLTVNVPDLYGYNDCAIQHILTVMPHKDGSFQYLSNTVTINNYRSDWFPNYTPRIMKSILG